MQTGRSIEQESKLGKCKDLRGWGKVHLKLVVVDYK